jgi:hypothetical protein
MTVTAVRARSRGRRAAALIVAVTCAAGLDARQPPLPSAVREAADGISSEQLA